MSHLHSLLPAVGLSALLEVVAKTSLILIAAVLVCRMAPRMSAAARRLVWFSALVAALLVPAFCGALPAWRALPSWLNCSAVDRALLAGQPITSSDRIGSRISDQFFLRRNCAGRSRHGPRHFGFARTTELGPSDANCQSIECDRLASICNSNGDLARLVADRHHRDAGAARVQRWR